MARDARVVVERRLKPSNGLVLRGTKNPWRKHDEIPISKAADFVASASRKITIWEFRIKGVEQ